jgi:hypothetical protein
MPPWSRKAVSVSPPSIVPFVQQLSGRRTKWAKWLRTRWLGFFFRVAYFPHIFATLQYFSTYGNFKLATGKVWIISQHEKQEQCSILDLCKPKGISIVLFLFFSGPFHWLVTLT